MDPLMGVDLGAGTHLEALRDKAINLSVKYWSLAVIYSTWLPEDWSLTCSGSVWLLYKYHTLTRAHFWHWFSKVKSKLVQFDLCDWGPTSYHAQDLRLQHGRAALMRVLEEFWGTRRRNAEYSLNWLVSFLISPSPLQEVCLNGCSRAGWWWEWMGRCTKCSGLCFPRE